MYSHACVSGYLWSIVLCHHRFQTCGFAQIPNVTEGSGEGQQSYAFLILQKAENWYFHFLIELHNFYLKPTCCGISRGSSVSLSLFRIRCWNILRKWLRRDTGLLLGSSGGFSGLSMFITQAFHKHKENAAEVAQFQANYI